MENVRNRVDIKLRTYWSGRYGVEALVSKPNFKRCTIFTPEFVAIEMGKTEVYMDKPIYAGFSILDISKICLYDFHYTYMKKNVGDNCKLLYCDTDSLIYVINGVNVYEMIKRDYEYFDTSDYKVPNVYGIEKHNNKEPSKMKDECKGRVVDEFYGNRSKVYFMSYEDEVFCKKLKGIKSSVVSATIDKDDYRRCLFDEVLLYRDQHIIRSRFHNVVTEKQTKLALSPYYDTRYLLPNTTETLPWGH